MCTFVCGGHNETRFKIAATDADANGLWKKNDDGNCSQLAHSAECRSRALKLFANGFFHYPLWCIVGIAQRASRTRRRNVESTTGCVIYAMRNNDILMRTTQFSCFRPILWHSFRLHSARIQFNYSWFAFFCRRVRADSFGRVLANAVAQSGNYDTKNMQMRRIQTNELIFRNCANWNRWNNHQLWNAIKLDASIAMRKRKMRNECELVKSATVPAADCGLIWWVSDFHLEIS